MKRFSTALLAAIGTDKSNPSALADALNLAPSSITRVVKGQRVASNDLVAACCGYYANKPSIAYALLVAHLLDVAESTGLDLGRLTVAFGDTRDVHSSTPAINSMLKTLGAEAARTPSLAALLQDLTQLALDYQRKVVQFPEPTPMELHVAEDLPRGDSQQPTA